MHAIPPFRMANMVNAVALFFSPAHSTKWCGSIVVKIGTVSASRIIAHQCDSLIPVDCRNIRQSLWIEAWPKHDRLIRFFHCCVDLSWHFSSFSWLLRNVVNWRSFLFIPIFMGFLSFFSLRIRHWLRFVLISLELDVELVVKCCGDARRIEQFSSSTASEEKLVMPETMKLEWRSQVDLRNAGCNFTWSDNEIRSISGAWSCIRKHVSQHESHLCGKCHLLRHCCVINVEIERRWFKLFFEPGDWPEMSKLSVFFSFNEFFSLKFFRFSFFSTPFNCSGANH